MIVIMKKAICLTLLAMTGTVAVASAQISAGNDSIYRLP